MTERRTFTLEEARDIQHAIDIAEGEIGELKIKKTLFEVYPELAEEEKEYAIRVQEAVDEQNRLRRITIDKFFSELDANKSILKQSLTFFENNYKFLRENKSDEICFPCDLMKYLPVEIGNKLAKELHENSENSKEDSYYRNKPDADMWHYHVHLIENMMYGRQKKNTR